MRMDSWFNLVLVCGLVIIESLNGANGSAIHERKHISQNLFKAVQTVQNQYNLTNNDWVGHAVFTPYLGKIETCTCESLVLAAMLNAYMDIFLDMLKNSQNTEPSLKGLQTNVTHLWNNKYRKQQTVLKQLEEIKLKDVKNHMIQGGAVNDFLSVYEMAFRIGQK